jgi:hypothetical protein
MHRRLGKIFMFGWMSLGGWGGAGGLCKNWDRTRGEDGRGASRGHDVGGVGCRKEMGRKGMKGNSRYCGTVPY